MTTLTLTRQPAAGMTTDERRVIFASSLGTVFEWYDFSSLRHARAVLRGAVLSARQ
jgi:hypothetical protein